MMDDLFDDYDDEDSDYSFDEYDDFRYFCDWHRGEWNVECVGEMPLAFCTFDLHPEARSLDNICQFDIYWIMKQVINILELVVIEAKNFQEEDIKTYTDIHMNTWQKLLEDISKIISVGKKIERKVMITLQMNLKKLLKLPDVIEIKILDFLLDQSVSDNDQEVVKFEERDENVKVRILLLKVYDYFCKVSNCIRKRLGVNRCKCYINDVIMVFIILEVEKIPIGEMEEEDGSQLKEYFEIEKEVVEDIWEDDELANSFRELFVVHISKKEVKEDSK